MSNIENLIATGWKWLNEEEINEIQKYDSKNKPLYMLGFTQEDLDTGLIPEGVIGVILK